MNPGLRFLMFKRLFSCLLLLLSGCATTSVDNTRQVGGQPPRAMADFSGSWELDFDLTESPRDKIRWLYEVARSQLEQQVRQQQLDVRRSGARMRPATVGAMNDLQGVIGLGALAESISRSLTLKIEQSADYIVVERQGDYALTCDFNRSGISSLPPDSKIGKEYCYIDAQGQLVFIVSLPEGLTVQNRMVMSSNGKRLNVATTLKATEFTREFTLNRVYMPFEPGESMFNCQYTLEKKKTCWLGTE